MMVSMTGYGKSSVRLGKSNLSIEVKSVNSKQLDLNLKMPGVLRDAENGFRTLIAKAIERGKADVYIRLEGDNGNSEYINTSLAKAYHNELKSLCKTLKIESSDLLAHVLKLPDLYQNKEKELTKAELKKAEDTLKVALKAFIMFRKAEGKELEKDILGRVKKIAALLKKVEEADAKRTTKLKERLRLKVLELGENVKIDQNRFEQELIYYLERNDITEEKVRLQSHCDYFIKTSAEESCGRKLGFISQEIGREINTIGSKSNDADMQKLVVEMKDELEKIKEQLNNIL